MTGSGGTPSRGRRAVSEVIGVVLLVAIVVILAGTVAYVLTGIDRGRPPTPQFSKVEDYNRLEEPNGQYLNVTHGSGEIVDTKDMSIVVTDAVVRQKSDDSSEGEAERIDGVGLHDQIGEQWKVDEELSVNASMFEDPTGPGNVGENPDLYVDLREASVKIVWVPQNEGTSDVLYRWKGPEA